MQIIFIHHSCFLVELDDKVLIFDYFDGDKVEGMHFTGKLPSYEKKETLRPNKLDRLYMRRLDFQLGLVFCY